MKICWSIWWFFDDESFELSGRLFGDIDAFIDAHYVKEHMAAEYEIPYPEVEALQRLDISVTLDEAKPIVFEDKMPPGPVVLRSMPAPETTKTPGVPKKLRKSKAPIPQARRLEYRHLDDAIAQLGENFRERLLRHIDERGLSDVEVYKRANLDRKLFSKIRCNPDYKPKKKTALALAIALELNLDETKDLLARAELALSPGSKSDLIVEYFIRQKVYDIYTINVALFAHGQPTLGD